MLKAIAINKSALVSSIVKTVISLAAVFSILAPQAARAQATEVTGGWNSEELVKIESLTKCGISKASYGVKKTVTMLVTAYTSDPWETDDTPEIAASGKKVFDGMVANNGLKFGTKVRIPDVYGTKIFVVEDRMHERKGKKMMDIWMERKIDAKEFGAQLLEIEILES